jgi:hypothetical protein
MKLLQKYPIGDPKTLVFMNPGQEGIALEFAKRLAAFFRDHGKTGYISSGYRSVERQKEIWFQNGGTYKNGEWIWNVIDPKTKKRKPQTVAVPGNSWHNGHCAIDLDDRNYWQAYMLSGDMHKTIKKQELYKYGLCLPLNYIDASSVYEWWHIQPVETIGYHGDRTMFLDQDDKIYGGDYEVTVKEFQQITGLTPDNIAGPKTQEKAKEVLKVVHEILGIPEYKTAEEVIRDIMSSPDGWLKYLNEIPHFDTYTMKIINKMKGE